MTTAVSLQAMGRIAMMPTLQALPQDLARNALMPFLDWQDRVRTARCCPSLRVAVQHGRPAIEHVTLTNGKYHRSVMVNDKLVLVPTDQRITSVKIIRAQLSEAMMEGILDRYLNLHSIDIGGCEDVESAVTWVLAGRLDGRPMVKLVLANTSHDDTPTVVRATAVLTRWISTMDWSRLEHLDVRRTTLWLNPDRTMNEIFAKMSASRIREIYLRFSPGVEELYLRSLPPTVQNIYIQNWLLPGASDALEERFRTSQIERVSLGYAPTVSLGDGRPLQLLISRLSQLKAVDLRGTYLSPGIAREMGEQLSRNSDFEEFAWENAYGEAMFPILEVLKGRPKLRSLRLKSPSFVDDRLKWRLMAQLLAFPPTVSMTLISQNWEKDLPFDLSQEIVLLYRSSLHAGKIVALLTPDQQAVLNHLPKRHIFDDFRRLGLTDAQIAEWKLNDKEPVNLIRFLYEKDLNGELIR
jgi:hypothetical protein